MLERVPSQAASPTIAADAATRWVVPPPPAAQQHPRPVSAASAAAAAAAAAASAAASASRAHEDFVAAVAPEPAVFMATLGAQQQSYAPAAGGGGPYAQAAHAYGNGLYSQGPPAYAQQASYLPPPPPHVYASPAVGAAAPSWVPTPATALGLRAAEVPVTPQEFASFHSHPWSAQPPAQGGPLLHQHSTPGEGERATAVRSHKRPPARAPDFEASSLLVVRSICAPAFSQFPCLPPPARSQMAAAEKVQSAAAAAAKALESELRALRARESALASRERGVAQREAAVRELSASLDDDNRAQLLEALAARNTPLGRRAAAVAAAAAAAGLPPGRASALYSPAQGAAAAVTASAQRFALLSREAAEAESRLLRQQIAELQKRLVRSHGADRDHHGDPCAPANTHPSAQRALYRV